MKPSSRSRRPDITPSASREKSAAPGMPSRLATPSRTTGAHTMQQRKANWGSSATNPLSIGELAEKTNRYMVCDCELGNFKVHDGRRLLDSLLQWQTVLPFDEITGLSDFEELREQQSAGPSLSEADQQVLEWLLVN